MDSSWVIPVGLLLAILLGLTSVKLLRLLHYKFIKFKRSRGYQKRFRKYRYWWPSVILGLLSFPLISYVANFYSNPVSASAAEWGQMGDFFGGMLNPILAFASFIALLYTIRIQSEELRLTREEFKKSTDAQQRMAGEAERSRKQSLLLEDYQYASGVLRNKIKALDEQMRAKLSLESDPSGGVAFIPDNLISLVGLISSNVFNLKRGLSNEELLSEGRLYVERNLMFAYKNESKIKSVVDDYARSVYELHQIFKLYSQCCFKLGIDVSKESVQNFDYKTATHHLLMAYIFVGVVEQVYHRVLFLPLFDSVAMENFNKKLESWLLQPETSYTIEK